MGGPLRLPRDTFHISGLKGCRRYSSLSSTRIHSSSGSACASQSTTVHEARRGQTSISCMHAGARPSYRACMQGPDLHIVHAYRGQTFISCMHAGARPPYRACVHACAGLGGGAGAPRGRCTHSPLRMHACMCAPARSLPCKHAPAPPPATHPIQRNPCPLAPPTPPPSPAPGLLKAA